MNLSRPRYLAVVVAAASAVVLACSSGGHQPGTSGATIQIQPVFTSVDPGASASFTATVQGTADTSVTWSVAEGGGGTVSGSGLYTAPGTTGTFHVVVTSHADPALQARATVRVTTIPTTPTDLCAGVGVSGKAKVPFSIPAKPALYQAITDPDFTNGATIRRITDVATQWPGITGDAPAGPALLPVYPTIPAWNADESYLFLYGGGTWKLFDGRSYAYLKDLDINPADVEQVYWDTTHPDLLYYVDNQQGGGGLSYAKLTRYHVSTDTKDVLHDFRPDMAAGHPLASCGSTAWLVSGGEDPFFMSFDNDLIGLGCATTTNGPSGSPYFYGFTYRLSTGQISSSLTHFEADVPQALPLGATTYAYPNAPNTIEVRDPVTQAILHTWPFDGSQHSDMVLSATGHEMIAGAQYDGPSGSGNLMTVDLVTGVVTTIFGEATGDGYPEAGTLVTGRAMNNPGWVAFTVIGDPKFSFPGSSNVNGTNYATTGTYLDQEIVLVNVDTKAFCRIAHSRAYGYVGNATYSDYWHQPNVTFSPSGTRLLFNSDWGGGMGAASDTYVIELPGY